MKKRLLKYLQEALFGIKCEILEAPVEQDEGIIVEFAGKQFFFSYDDISDGNFSKIDAKIKLVRKLVKKHSSAS